MRRCRAGRVFAVHSLLIIIAVTPLTEAKGAPPEGGDLLATGTAPANESAYQASTRLRARAALMEAAGQVERALSLYQQAWRVFPQDAVVDRIIEVGRSSGQGTSLVPFLHEARAAIMNDDARKRLDDFLAEADPEFMGSHGRVEFRVFPPHARVVVADRTNTYRVRSGEHLWLEPGQVTLRATASQHKPEKRAFEVKAESSDALVVFLEPAGSAGRVTISSKPDGAEISVDGLVVGPAPVLNLPVKPGTHIVAARLAGYTPVRRPLRVEVGEAGGVQLTLEKIPEAPKVEVAGTGGGTGRATAGPPGAGAGDSPLGIPGAGDGPIAGPGPKSTSGKAWRTAYAAAARTATSVVSPTRWSASSDQSHRIRVRGWSSYQRDAGSRAFRIG